MVEVFRNLKMKGAYVRDMMVSPRKKFLLGVMIPHVDRSEGTLQTTRSYDVQFNKVADFEINVSAAPWLEILSQDVLSSSSLIDRFVAREQGRASTNMLHTPLHHFRIVFDEGQVDVLAETCTVSLVEELPAFDSTEEPA